MEKLDTDFAAALQRLKTPQRDRAFPIATSLLPIQRQKENLKRQDRALAKKFVRPENAQNVVAALPIDEGDRTHAIVAGDFVFNDLLCLICQINAPCRLSVATLSLSEKNVEALERELIAGQLKQLTLVVSHYFQSTSKTIFGAIHNRLASRADCKIVVARSHMKVAVFTFNGQAPLVVEGSANLRSSGNIEQLSIFRDTALAQFHQANFARIANASP